ncbi:unnamed protein product [Effrenium voratum]|uniref:Uncharacterized protein n=1 Tax=Effrenium voratum TaxID=2562239 RepID=A0AA36J690_9DINO|nr:unnamed protein product [Effrenium voratum]CAJ1418246.1 unnamed protein product [Effrenium voratum]
MYDNTYIAMGKMVRVDTTSFSSADVVDLAQIDTNYVQFKSAFTDGTYGYLVPNSFGRVVRFTLDPFAFDAEYDVSLLSSSWDFGMYDGTYGYLVGDQSTSNVVRFTWGGAWDTLDMYSSHGVFSGFYSAFVSGSDVYLFETTQYSGIYRHCKVSNHDHVKHHYLHVNQHLIIKHHFYLKQLIVKHHIHVYHKHHLD